MGCKICSYPTGINHSKLRILVTGATGFIGNAVTLRLLDQGHEVIAVLKGKMDSVNYRWHDRVKLVHHDLSSRKALNLKAIGRPDGVIHLAWAGLPNYFEMFHIEKNLFDSYFFLKSIIEQGVGNILVTGTCLEYGMTSGPIAVDQPADPKIPYTIAKDSLRRFLEQLKHTLDFKLKWVRLFYIYGEGQRSNSLFGQLNDALDSGKPSFNMSFGEQIRDYSHIHEIADQLCQLIVDAKYDGIINGCSGKPVSVRSLVERLIKESGKKIQLNLGHYPYPDYEPMAFWGIKNYNFQPFNKI